MSLIRSFRFAFLGLGHIIRTQRNFRIELAIGIGACAIGAWSGLSSSEWAALITVIALVLILEGLNTSLELAVDLASPAIHPKAKAAKDVAAGMVLVAALASIGVGAALFGSRLVRLLGP